MKRTVFNTALNLSFILFALHLFLNPITLKAQNNCQMLCNSDFEDNKIVDQNSYKIVNQNQVPCWKTSASDENIEVWGSNFGGVPAYSGNQFIELNANMVSTLYQDFTAVLSSTIQVSFAHRGRSGVDVLSVEIGPVGGPYHSFGSFSADNTKWSYNTVKYTFPSTGTKNYTLRFNSISAAGGSNSVGNFLDAISVYLPAPVIKSMVIDSDCPSAKNGSIELQVTGGNGPFTFKWNPPVGKTSQNIRDLGAGDYHVVITDNYGCMTAKDYTVEIKNKEYNKAIYVIACDSFYWNRTHKMYKTSGKYVYSTLTSSGCDSISTLNLVVGNTTKRIETETACGSYYWEVNKKTYTKSGVYSHLGKTIFGCKSVITLNLTVHPAFKEVLEVKSKLPYTWPENGMEYTETGVYQLNYQTRFGCDSIFILKFVLDKIDSLFIPNTFTPNGDGLNDTWGPKGNNVDWFQSTVYNRWGEQIWTGAVKQSFDGFVQGARIPQGVYTYIVMVMNRESERKYYRGTLTSLD